MSHHIQEISGLYKVVACQYSDYSAETDELLSESEALNELAALELKTLKAGLIYKFTLDSQSLELVIEGLKSEGLEHIEASQTGNDITIYLQGHPSYEKSVGGHTPQELIEINEIYFNNHYGKG